MKVQQKVVRVWQRLSMRERRVMRAYVPSMRLAKSGVAMPLQSNHRFGAREVAHDVGLRRLVLRVASVPRRRAFCRARAGGNGRPARGQWRAQDQRGLRMGSVDCRGMLAASLRLLADHMDARTLGAGAGSSAPWYHSQRDHGLSAIQAASRAAWGRLQADRGLSLDQGPSDAAFAATSQTQCAPCGRNEVVVYVDEVDIHLNPKIGPTTGCFAANKRKFSLPERTRKRYLAGHAPGSSHRPAHVGGSRTQDQRLVHTLAVATGVKGVSASQVYSCDPGQLPEDSLQPARTQLPLASSGGRIRLHFQTPNCPDHNRIERVWKDLHDNVTRNHCCRNMQQLMMEVYAYLRCRTHHQRHEYVRTRVA